MYNRICKPLLSKSFFLFGLRGSGKTSLLKELFQNKKNVVWINLLDPGLYQELLAKPNRLLNKIPSNTEWVICDEIQRLPELLNIVHQLIEERKIKFALTGSSARKLKRAAANLLAGRAFVNTLFPLTYDELKQDFRLDHALNFGLLPSLFSMPDTDEKIEYLRAYSGTYLKEEIKEEQVIRQIEPFSRFLEVAAQHSGKIINASKIGRDANVDYNAILRYYEILSDTWVGFYLEPYHKSARKVQTSKSKFYFYDQGIKKSLEGSLRSPCVPRTSAYGEAFESFVITEIKKRISYLKLDHKLYYIRTKDDVEIDLLIEGYFSGSQRKGLMALEIKSSESVDEKELSKSIKLARNLGIKTLWVASNEQMPREIQMDEVLIKILPWSKCIEELIPDSK